MSPSSKCMCHKTYAHTDTHTRYSTPNTSTRASRAHNSDVGWFVTQDFPGNSDCRRKTVESLLPRPNACAKTHKHKKTSCREIVSHNVTHTEIAVIIKKHINNTHHQLHKKRN